MVQADNSFKLPFETIQKARAVNRITEEQMRQLMRENGYVGIQARGMQTGPTAQEIQHKIDTRLDPTVIPDENNAQAFGAGLGQGIKEIGSGILQVGLGVADRVGLLPDDVDYDAAQERLRGVIVKNKEDYGVVSEENPYIGGAGRITGNIIGTAPALLAAPTVGMSALAGGASAFFMPTESENATMERLTNTAFGAILGGTLQKALPVVGRLLARGASKTSAMAAALFEKATGSRFRPNFIDADGKLTQAAIAELDRVGIKVADVEQLGQGLDANAASDIRNAFLRGVKNRVREDITDPQALARIERGAEFDVPLTGARINQDFGQQTAENIARGLDDTLGVDARAAAVTTTDALETASERFLTRLGGSKDATGPEIGVAIKKGIMDVNNLSQAEVRRLYGVARELVGSKLRLDANPLLQTFDDIFDMTALEQKVKDPLEALFAKYGLLGKAAPDNPNLVNLSGRNVTVRGGPKDLNLENAEIFRQELNKLFPADKTGGIASVIRTLDDQVDDAISKAIRGKQTGSGGVQARQDAFEAARGSRRTRATEFEQSDIVEQLVSIKKGTVDTPILEAAQLSDRIFAKGKGFANIERLENVLLKGSGSKNIGQTIWQDVQRLSVDRLFKDALTDGVFSGARLNSAFRRLGGGDEREATRILTKLLGKKSYAEFQRFRQLAADATIDLKGTTNPSGTGMRIVNSLIQFVSGVQGFGTAGRVMGSLVRGAADKVETDAAKQAALKTIRAASAQKLTPKIARGEELLAAFLARYATLGLVPEATSLTGQ